MKKKLGFLMLVLSVLVFGLAGCGSDEPVAATTTESEVATEEEAITEELVTEDTETEVGQEPAVIEWIDINELTVSEENPIVEIEVADYGIIVVELFPDYAPVTVENFLTLVEDGFYNGLTFHRIMEGFMMQGGCTEGTGIGGSDEMIIGEFLANGIANPIHHTRGVLSMARMGHDYDSASSQFFIMHADALFLDAEYAAFGRVITGMEVVDAAVESVTPLDNNGTIDPAEQPIIKEVRVVNGE